MDRTHEQYVALGHQMKAVREVLGATLVMAGQMFPKHHHGVRALERTIDVFDQSRSDFDEQFFADDLYDELLVPVFPMYPASKGPDAEEKFSFDDQAESEKR